MSEVVLADGTIHLHIDDEERLSDNDDEVNSAILDATDDEDPTPPLRPASKKFVPRNIITAPSPAPPNRSASPPISLHVPLPAPQPAPQPAPPPAPVVTQRASNRLRNRLGFGNRRKTRVEPYAPRNAPIAQSSTVMFPTPSPPAPKYTEFMVSSLCSMLIHHSRDSFNIMLKEAEVKSFLKSASKEYCP